MVSKYTRIGSTRARWHRLEEELLHPIHQRVFRLEILVSLFWKWSQREQGYTLARIRESSASLVRASSYEPEDCSYQYFRSVILSRNRDTTERRLDASSFDYYRHIDRLLSHGQNQNTSYWRISRHASWCWIPVMVVPAWNRLQLHSIPNLELLWWNYPLPLYVYFSKKSFWDRCRCTTCKARLARN